MGDNIDLIIRNREGILYSNNVLSISSNNDVGKFDVLPGHANFITVINDKVIIRTKGESEQFDIRGEAIMKVINNKAYIYLGI